MPNGGQMPNGWRYRFSITQTLSLDGSSEFENGVPPDSQIYFNWPDRTRDEVPEAAIAELL